ncbi:MAG: TonB-dependent receptor [Acidobacteria bacterium]|nr:TonB-dependent receptor [Acidobacteriota bacterium]
MSRRVLSVLFVSALVLFLAAVPVAAQSSRGTVNGQVTDPSGAMVAGAQVELRSQQTGIVRTTTTNDSGVYRFDAVDLGDYVVYVKAGGFNSFTTQPFPVQAGQTRTADCRLEVGEQRTVVQVEEAASPLQVEAPVRGASLQARQIVDLPVATRNPASLALIAPGVSSNRTGPGVATFIVNGARGRSNNFLIDGTENNDISVAGQAFQITNPDAVQEVSVQTSNYDSEYGRAGGGVVNVITKGGTNTLHGTASLLLDVTNDDATTYNQSLDPAVQRRGKPMPGTEQWWAGTVGGPIRKNKAFFFQSWQEQRQRSSGTTDVNAPSAAGRARLNQLFPKGTNPRADLFNSVTGGLDATSQFFNVPLGGGRPDVEFGTVIVPYAQTQRDRQSTTRIDTTLNDKNLLSGRYLYSQPVNDPATLNWPGFMSTQQYRYQNAVANWTRIISPTMTNELRLPYNRITMMWPNDVANPLGQTMPLYNIDGLITSSVGAGIGGYMGVQTNMPQGRIANNYGLQDTFSLIKGTHSIRFGVDLLKQRSKQFAPITQRGQLTYRAGGGYSGLANFLDDFGGSTGQAILDFGSPAYYPSLFRHAYFVQDRWRATSRLTVTVGMRYEYFGLPVNSLRTPAYTGLFNIDPVNFTGPYSQPNQVAADRNNFSPGIGVAYKVTDKTVVRTGYQIGYDSFFNNIASNAAVSSPNVVSTQYVSQVTTDLPRGTAAFSSQLPRTPRALTPLDSQTLVDPKLVNPYYQRWSFGVQRELPANLLLDVSYVGSKGTKLFATEALNPIVPASMQINPPNVASVPASRLSTRYDRLQGSRNIRTNNGSSTYSALQTQVTRRLSHGLSGTMAYTWSKMLDYGSELFAYSGAAAVSAVPSIFGGLKGERAVSLFDRTHRTALALNYDVPFMKDKRSALGLVAGGWAVSGVYTYETGVPVNISNGQDADGLDGSNDRPNFNPAGRPGSRAIPSAASPTGYIDPDGAGRPAVDPATAMYIGIAANTTSNRMPTGNLGRNTFRSRPTNNLNLNAMKRVRMTERFTAEFRAEFYNLLNHPQYGQGSVSPFAPLNSTVSANVFTSPAGRFLNSNVLDGGGRVIRYQLKFLF